jgi:SAM-dependent methyltransferase
VTTAGFPPGFFARDDDADDRVFYGPPRLVTHIDEGAIAAVGELYDDLGIDGDVLDLMSSWISHFRTAPARLVALGMNAQELARNPQAVGSVVHDLNAFPSLPFAAASFDAVVCCVSVDYLVRPIEVFRDAARVVRPGGVLACSFSNRCFPTKAIRGWLLTGDQQHMQIVTEYFARAGGWERVTHATRRAGGPGRDPLYAVWGYRSER